MLLTHRNLVSSLLATAAGIALSGCQTQPPDYGQRPLTHTEAGWYGTMTEWYPNWQEPVRPIPPRGGLPERMSTIDGSTSVAAQPPRIVTPPPPVATPPATPQAAQPTPPTPVVQPVFDFPEQRGSVPAGTQPFRVIPAGATPAAANKSRPQWYSVQKGDTLASIAKRFYGSADAWRSIYQANRQSLSAPDRLKIGTRLRLP